MAGLASARGGVDSLLRRGAQLLRATTTDPATESPANANLQDFCAKPSVRARILEFLGGRGSRPSCLYLDEPLPDSTWRRIPPGDLWSALGSGREVSRSLADAESLLVDLDLEYLDFDAPGRGCLDPRRCFAMQRPVVDALLGELTALGIEPLHLLTGRGHHFLWRIAADSDVVEALAELGARVPTEQGAKRARPGHTRRRLAAAHLGLGQMLEYLAHRVLERMGGRAPTPVMITAVEVGAGSQGREIVSIDLSEYGDPLLARRLRLPFSSYRKWLPAKSRPLLVIPVVGGDEAEALRARTDLGAASALAERSSTRIPEQTAPSANLLDAYCASPLARVHEWFYGAEHSPAPSAKGRETAALAQLPPCARQPLDAPNDRLLQPAELQMVTRSLLALGWHPRRIVELVRSRYAADFGWKPGIHFHDPGPRADFYVRIFTSLFAAGRDDLIDYNCRSTQEKRECPGGACSLAPFRDSLLARRLHGRLAGRPLDGLLLPDEHPAVPRSGA